MKQVKANGGKVYIYITAGALGMILLLLSMLVLVVVGNSISVMWPAPLATIKLRDQSVLLGEIVQHEYALDGHPSKTKVKIGNREIFGTDFKWLNAADIVTIEYQDDALALERTEHGNFYGFLATNSPIQWQDLPAKVRVVEDKAMELEGINEAIDKLNKLNDRCVHERQKIQFSAKPDSTRLQALQLEMDERQKLFDAKLERIGQLNAELAKITLGVVDAAGHSKDIPLHQIVRHYQPNSMPIYKKVLFYLSKVVELLSSEPRESNTEGGLFPAIFGTVMLIFVMSIVSFPLGVLAGIYLKEYSSDGLLVRLVRIAVNNLAGIPSIVFGIFGLGFFIYGIGGSIDQAFFPEKLPTPTYGTGGLLWASLTLGLLTVPVVIIATEEALGVIPQGIRQAAFALGATKFQTLVKVLLPMASPGILTGFILAMSRAAGEVAPLMITGVVKLAPALPVDGEFPYLHLDRKFMHLGFHIYDVGFQSPNVDAAKPMVYVTTFLLLVIVIVMSSGAIILRNRMKKKYSSSTL